MNTIEGTGEGFSWMNLSREEIEELAEGVVKRNGDELDLGVGGGVISRGKHFVGNGEGIEGAIVAVVAEFGLKGGGGAMHGEVPLLRAGEDVDLVDTFLAGDEDLQKDLAGGRFLLGVAQLLPGKVPVGVEPAGIAGG